MLIILSLYFSSSKNRIRPYAFMYISSTFHIIRGHRRSLGNNFCFILFCYIGYLKHSIPFYRWIGTYWLIAISFCVNLGSIDFIFKNCDTLFNLCWRSNTLSSWGGVLRMSSESNLFENEKLYLFENTNATRF